MKIHKNRRHVIMLFSLVLYDYGTYLDNIIIFCYKIISGYISVNCDDFFIMVLNTNSVTHGNTDSISFIQKMIFCRSFY